MQSAASTASPVSERRTPGGTGRRIAKVAAWVVVCSAVALAGAALYFSSERGHRTLADALEALVSDQIPGTLKIGRLESFGMFEPDLRDLRFIHPNGTTVLHLDRARVDVDL